jgi:hypothetical protein
MLSLLEPVLKEVLVEALRHQRRLQGKDIKTGIGFISLAGFLSCLGLIFLFYALYSHLAVSYTPAMAALIVGLGSSALSLIAAFAGMRILKGREKKLRDNPALTETLQAALAGLTQEWEDPIRKNPGTAVLIAGLAGYMANKHMH